MEEESHSGVSVVDSSSAVAGDPVLRFNSLSQPHQEIAFQTGFQR